MAYSALTNFIVSKWAGFLAAIFGAAFASTKPIFIKLAYLEDTNVVGLLTLRTLFSLPVFLLIGYLTWRHLKRRNRLPKTKYLYLAALNGFLGYYLASLLDFTGLLYITAQLERLILFTYPFFVVLIGRIFFQMPLKPRAIPALCISYFGISLVFTQALQLHDMNNLLLGSGLVLAAGIAFALFQILGSNLINVVGGSLLYTSITMSSASILILLHFSIQETESIFHTSQSMIWIGVGIAIFATILPIYMVNFALGRIGAGSTGIIGNIGPMVTITLSAWLLKEPFGVWEAIGTGLVVFSMIYFMRAKE